MSIGRLFHAPVTRLVKKNFRTSNDVFSATRLLLEYERVDLQWRSRTKENNLSGLMSLKPFKYLKHSIRLPRSRRSSSDWRFSSLSLDSYGTFRKSVIRCRLRLCTFSSLSTSPLFQGFQAGAAVSSKGRTNDLYKDVMVLRSRSIVERRICHKRPWAFLRFYRCGQMDHMNSRHKPRGPGRLLRF